MTATANTDQRRRLQAQIHIARKQLGLDEDTYRAALMRITGKTSSANLSATELFRVVEDFKKKGFKVTRSHSPRSRHKRDDHKTQVDKIRALWITMAQIGIVTDGSEAALDAWIKHQTSMRNGGAGVDRAGWLESDGALAQMVLESLKKWRARVLRQWQNDDLRLISQEQTERDRPQADVVRELLDAGRIMWWPIFNDLNIEPMENYIANRRSLNHA
jgi:phage gp16-like protein